MRYSRYIFAFIVGLSVSISAFQNCSGQFEVQDEMDPSMASSEVAISLQESVKIRDGNLFVCPILACAPPPAGCRLVPDKLRDVDERGCPRSCGRPICDGAEVRPGEGTQSHPPPPPTVLPPKGPTCPKFFPPISLGAHCRVEPSSHSGTGCPTFRVVCEPKPRVDCPVYTAVMPPDGCRYTDSLDENGCRIRTTICDSKKPAVCPVYSIAQPAPGCFFREAGYDKNGCRTPGVLICEGRVPLPGSRCIENVAFHCPQPPAGCRYGVPDVDANGCKKPCSNLECRRDLNR